MTLTVLNVLRWLHCCVVSYLCAYENSYTQIGNITEISYRETFVLPEFLYLDVYLRATDHRTVTCICTHRVCVSTVVFLFRVPEYGRFHCTFRQMQVFCAVQYVTKRHT